MRCIDLVEVAEIEYEGKIDIGKLEMHGNISIAGCKLRENVDIAKIMLSQFGRNITEENNTLTCNLIGKRYRFNQIIEDDYLAESKIVCHYNTIEDIYLNETKIIYEIEYYMYFNDRHPYKTVADFEERLDDWIVLTKLFKKTNIIVHPNLKYNETYLESKECEIELQWSKPDEGDIRFILFRVLPPITSEDGTVFNSSAAIAKSEKLLALELGKKVEELNHFEQINALNRIGLSVLDIDVP